MRASLNLSAITVGLSGLAMSMLSVPALAQLPSMTTVGAPNMFSQNGQMNTQQNTSLPNAFNWHPYMPGVPAAVNSSAAPSPSYQIVNPQPTYQGRYNYNYNNYNYYGDNGGGGSWGGYGGGSIPSGRSGRPAPPSNPKPTVTVQSNGQDYFTTKTGTARPVPPPPSNSTSAPYFYNSTVTVLDGNGVPILVGGYYYPNYCDQSDGPNVYPSVYSNYGGFPGYIYSPGPGVSIVSDPYYPQYSSSYAPFNSPSYQVTYNQTNYYAATPQSADAIEDGGESARKAVKSAYSEDTYQAAFADIEQAWSTGDLALIRKHLRDDDTKISVLINRKYAYSISSGDYSQITRDAMKKLNTVSFKFTRLRKAKNGDVTAYAVHTYEPQSASDDSATDDTVAFDTSNGQDTASSGGGTNSSRGGVESDDSASKPADASTHKTMFVSYTLRKTDDGWIIVLVDSSTKKLVPSQTVDSDDSK